MTGFDRHDMQRLAVSAMGALLISTACIAAAVSPAKAADLTTAPSAVAWQAQVERKIDNEMRTPSSVTNRVVMAEVAMRFDSAGHFETATLRNSSGMTEVDREALRIANSIQYPVLPTHLQGKPQSIAMQIFFGNDGNAVATHRNQAHAIGLAKAADADANRAEAKIAGQPKG